MRSQWRRWTFLDRFGFVVTVTTAFTIVALSLGTAVNGH